MLASLTIGYLSIDSCLIPIITLEASRDIAHSRCEALMSFLVGWHNQQGYAVQAKRLSNELWIDCSTLA